VSTISVLAGIFPAQHVCRLSVVLSSRQQSSSSTSSHPLYIRGSFKGDLLRSFYKKNLLSWKTPRKSETGCAPCQKRRQFFFSCSTPLETGWHLLITHRDYLIPLLFKNTSYITHLAWTNNRIQISTICPDRLYGCRNFWIYHCVSQWIV
jgi:hypothetical protein